MTTRRSFLRSLLSVAAVAAAGGVTAQTLTKSLSSIEELPLYSTGTLTPNIWNNIVVTRSMYETPSAVRLYLNGDRVSDIDGLSISDSSSSGKVDIALKGTQIATVSTERLGEIASSDDDFTLEWWAKPPASTPTDMLDGEILAYDFQAVTSKG